MDIQIQAMQRLSKTTGTACAMRTPMITPASSKLGAIGENLINAQFSQSQEYDADAYGLKLMQTNGKNQQGAVTALRKLAMPGRAPSMFDTHPKPGKRVDRIASNFK